MIIEHVLEKIIDHEIHLCSRIIKPKVIMIVIMQITDQWVERPINLHDQVIFILNIYSLIID